MLTAEHLDPSRGVHERTLGSGAKLAAASRPPACPFRSMRLKKAGAPGSWKPASECGLPVSTWAELPGLKTSVGAVVCALLPDVADERVEVGRANRFGPVADLPESQRMVGGETVEGAAGRSLQQMSDLRDGNSWWVSQQHMHVVSGVACRENPSVKAARFTLEQGCTSGYRARAERRGGPQGPIGRVARLLRGNGNNRAPSRVQRP